MSELTEEQRLRIVVDALAEAGKTGFVIDTTRFPIFTITGPTGQEEEMARRLVYYYRSVQVTAEDMYRRDALKALVAPPLKALVALRYEHFTEDMPAQAADYLNEAIELLGGSDLADMDPGEAYEALHPADGEG